MEGSDKNLSAEKEILGKKVMWIEDDPTLNDIMERWLARFNVDLVHTTNGTEGLELLRKEHPDILLLDIMLPDIDGFTILEKMKNDPELKDIPVILFSNLSHQKDVDKGYSLGASRFMVKSTVFLDNLATEIRNVLRENDRL
ncbi:MAG: response regulator [Candidatus Paceibacterota bacterium]